MVKTMTKSKFKYRYCPICGKGQKMLKQTKRRVCDNCTHSFTTERKRKVIHNV